MLSVAGFSIPRKNPTQNTSKIVPTSQVYNLEQRVGDKLTKLSKIHFSMECFTADFLGFFTKKRQNLVFGWTAGYSPSNPSNSGIFLKFPNFLRSEVLSCSVTREATRTLTFW